ncbi:MAG TPA: EscU/YscU/HrcU family type III secretion system export apparatus switch protein, partial [Anaerolineaceae bacterium]|nr:EscU/YscU/HrcU family type III secretion system export apparatus switch protein [Anaerolineaceae bacterium]
VLVSSVVDMPRETLTDVWVRDWTIRQVSLLLPGMAAILFGLLVTGVAITFAQTGFLWSTKRIGFDFKRVNPMEGFKRIFSSQGLIELARALLKLGVVGWVAYSFLRGQISDLLQLSQMDLASGLQRFTSMAISLATRVGWVYLILAAADYAYQRWRYMRSMRMTKEEVKEDFKRSEGDPFLRSRIRAQQRRIARNRMMSRVPKANVVVTNPTHFAVAIEYDPARMSAPRVVAKGAYAIAQRIVALARENNVPVVQNIPLARSLYRTVELEQEIPPDLYAAMAEVLAYVYRLRGTRAPAVHS